ncbi:hypothetical protein ACFL59_13100 [Planctomycetota bacterium]
MLKRRLLAAAGCLSIVVAALGYVGVGCGGGGGGLGLAVLSLGGTAAFGKPIADAKVTIRDRNGLPVMEPDGTKEKKIETDADGKYSAVLSGMKPPFLVRVEGPQGPVYSLSSAGGIANLHPLSQFVFWAFYRMEGIDPGRAFQDLENDPLPVPVEEDMQKLIKMLQEAFTDQLTDVSLPALFDPVRHPFAANSLGFDLLLDRTKMRFVAGNQLELTTDIQGKGESATATLNVNATTRSVTATTLFTNTGTGATRTTTTAAVTFEAPNFDVLHPTNLQLDFGNVAIASHLELPVVITNKGGSLLRGQATATSPFLATGPEFRLLRHETQTFMVRFSPNAEKSWTGKLTLSELDRFGRVKKTLETISLSGTGVIGQGAVAQSAQTTLQTVATLVQGGDDFQQASQDFDSALSQNPYNENAKVFKALTDFAHAMRTKLLDVTATTGTARKLLRDAGLLVKAGVEAITRNVSGKDVFDGSFERPPATSPMGWHLGVTDWRTATKTGSTPGGFQIRDYLDRYMLSPQPGTYHTVGPDDGSYYAVATQTMVGPGTYALWHEFTVPPSPRQVLLSFSMFVDDHDDTPATATLAGELDHNISGNRYASVDLLGGSSPIWATSGQVLRKFYEGVDKNRINMGHPSYPQGIPQNQYTDYVFDITNEVKGGGKFIIRFAQVSATSTMGSNLHTGVDNVSVNVETGALRTPGAMWDMELVAESHGQGDVKNSAPNSDKVIAFIEQEFIPELTKLDDVLKAVSPAFDYAVSDVDSRGDFFDGNTIDDTAHYFIDWGDIQMLRGALRMFTAWYDLLTSYDVKNVTPNDFDKKDTPGLDTMAMVDSKYPNLGKPTTTAKTNRTAARTKLEEAYQLYKAGATFIRGETPQQSDNGLLTVGRDTFDSAQDRTQSLAKEVAFRLWADGVQSRFSYPGPYLMTTGPTGKKINEAEIDFYKFWEDGVDLRGLYFKKVYDPHDKESWFGVTALTQLTSDMATLGGIIHKLKGLIPTGADLHASAFVLRVENPKTVATGTISVTDSSLSDWPADATLIAQNPPLSASHSTKPAVLGTPPLASDFGNVHIAVDSQYLYIKVDKDITSFDEYEFGFDADDPVTKHEVYAGLHYHPHKFYHLTDKVGTMNLPPDSYKVGSFGFEMKVQLSLFPNNTYIWIDRAAR